jgi:hypothetical protein
MNFVVRRYFSNSHFIKNLLENELIPLRKQSTCLPTQNWPTCARSTENV